MSLVAVLVTAAVIWLSWRAAQLWTLPLTVVLRHLNIELPAAPRLTIDALTADSVSLHWLPPEALVKKHIIQMDGQEVGVSQKGETSVTISGLTADYLYSVQVIAVNAQGFQMASPAIYLRTRPKEEIDHEVNEQSAEPHIQTSLSSTEICPPLRAPRKKGSFDNKGRDSSSVVVLSDDKNHYEIGQTNDVLRSKLETIIKDTADIDAQLVQLQDNHTHEEANLNTKLEELRTRKKEEDDARAAKDLQHKQLDQQKREIESKRNHVQKALKAEQEAYRKKTTDIASFRSSVKNSIETADHLNESLKTLKSETDEAVQEAIRNGSIAAEELSEIESEIRYLLSRKAESEIELARLMSTSRKPSPSPQETAESAQADSAWTEREESLIRQYEEVQQMLVQLQSSTFPVADRSLGTPNSDPGPEHAQVPMRRKISRRSRLDDISRPDSANRANGVPTFNPDAAPFVASMAAYTNNDTNFNSRLQAPQQSFSSVEQYYSQMTYPPQHDPIANTRSIFPNHSAQGVTSIFGSDSAGPILGPVFPRRESPISSQSGSNPPSPAIQNRLALPSIFNTAPTIQARNNAGNLVDRLNGTPLTHPSEHNAKANTDGSKWFWPKKTPSDPLALDRKNTRSLPKSDVAPIGTRRNRSGSLREEVTPVRISPGPTSNGYHDVDLLNAIGHPLSRETSVEKDGYSTSAFPLPRPSNGRAFGWEPQVPSSQRHLPNPWSSIEAENQASAPRPFDPFGDLPVSNGSAFSSYKDLPSSTNYHTTIDSSRLSSLHREQSNGSRKSGKSKTEDSREKPRRMGEKKFSSFVGRVFGKREDKEDAGEERSSEFEEGTFVE